MLKLTTPLRVAVTHSRHLPQVDLVLECVDSAQQGGSIVKQMIMGAGKTSVVSPLICLMLAQGDSLVLQCVPPALLPMSFNVLRTTFSSAIQKRVYSFQCERATVGKRSLHAKLLSAKQNSAVVITTPPAVKSLMLKVTVRGSDSIERLRMIVCVVEVRSIDSIEVLSPSSTVC